MAVVSSEDGYVRAAVKHPSVLSSMQTDYSLFKHQDTPRPKDCFRREGFLRCYEISQRSSDKSIPFPGNTSSMVKVFLFV